MLLSVNYIVDDAYDKAQIRGYSFRPEDFTLPAAVPTPQPQVAAPTLA